MEIANANTDEKNDLKTAKLERKLGRNLNVKLSSIYCLKKTHVFNGSSKCKAVWMPNLPQVVQCSGVGSIWAWGVHQAANRQVIL